MKIIGTSFKEVNKYPIDYCSILHFIGGIFGYFVSYFLISMFLPSLTTCFLSLIVVINSGIFWEIVENTWLRAMKINKRQDNVINSQFDVVWVFLGGILGAFMYNWDVIITVIIIGLLFLAYGVGFLGTKNLSKKKKPS